MSKSAKLIIILLVLLIVTGVVGAVLLARVVSRPKGEEAADPAAPTAPVKAAPAVTGKALERVRARGELVVIMDTGTPPWVGSPPMFLPSVGEGPPEVTHPATTPSRRTS